MHFLSHLFRLSSDLKQFVFELLLRGITCTELAQNRDTQPRGLSQSRTPSSLCHTATSHELSVLHVIMDFTVVLEKTLESPLDCMEIKPVILKEISLEYSLEGLMLKL